MIELSIIILTCNQKELTLRCLESLKGVEKDGKTEVIIVDNGSKDGTYDRIISDFPWVKYIKLEENQGVAAGRNIGLGASEGKKLLILDNDTIATLQSIKELSGFLDQNPQCGLVAPRLTDKKGRTQTSFKSFPSILNKIKNGVSKKRNNEYVEELPIKPIEPFYVIGAAQMFRRDVWEKVGPLDENIFYGPEDADFCIRVRKEGYKVIYYPDVTIIHDWQRATTGKLFNKKSIQHIKSLLYFYIKYRRIH